MKLKEIFHSPWIFVSMLFLAVGAGGGGIVGSMTTVMFKDFGYSNVLIGAVALLSLPSSFRFLWAPWVDGLASKRALCCIFTIIMGGIVISLGGLTYFGYFSPWVAFVTIGCFAFAFSCLEVSSDGYYIRILDKNMQAKFVGIKTAAIRAGIILSIAVFIRLGGELQEIGWTKDAAWGGALLLAAVVLLGLGFYYFKGLPQAVGDAPVRDAKGFPLFSILGEYVRQPRAWAIILLLLIFRFGQGMQVYMVPPFLMDTAEAGGYGMSPKDLALLKTYAEMPFMIIGGILGGLIIKRYGLKRTLIPFTLLMNVPNFAYVYLAMDLPQQTFSFLGTSFYVPVFLTSVMETLGYGIGFSAFYYYIHAIAEGRHKTSMLAISSGLLGLGFYLPGGVSGIVQQWLGYPSLFILSSAMGLLVLFIVPFLPMPKEVA